jgi:uncharacterized protein
MSTSTNHLHELDEEECYRLLRSHVVRVGRVAFTDGDTVMILPVNYQVHRNGVVFRTDPGSKLSAAMDGQPLGFEVDEVDAAWHEGWSVLMQGHGELVTDAEELEQIDATGLWAWAGLSSHTVRFVPTRITGRRIT